MRGDMGTSLLYRQSVSKVLGERLANSMWLMAFAWAVSGVLGLGLGLIAGANRGRWPDRLIKGGCLALNSTPAFWLALLLLLVFSVWLKVLPIGLAVPIVGLVLYELVFKKNREAVIRGEKEEK